MTKKNATKKVIKNAGKKNIPNGIGWAGKIPAHQASYDVDVQITVCCKDEEWGRW